jgi:hypothetical protein
VVFFFRKGGSVRLAGLSFNQFYPPHIDRFAGVPDHLVDPKIPRSVAPPVLSKMTVIPFCKAPYNSSVYITPDQSLGLPNSLSRVLYARP